MRHPPVHLGAAQLDVRRPHNFRTALGTNQARLFRLNVTVLKLRALATWVEPSRTRLALVVLFASAAILTLVPARLLFTAGVLVAFSKPLRNPGVGLLTLASRRFWGGLPAPALSDGAYAALAVDEVTGSLVPAGGRGGRGVQAMR